MDVVNEQRNHPRAGHPPCGKHPVGNGVRNASSCRGLHRLHDIGLAEIDDLRISAPYCSAEPVL